MNNTRLLKLAIGPVLILAAFTAWQAFGALSSPKVISPVYAGRGDYHIYEEKISRPDAGSRVSSPMYTGRGDYLLYEERISVPVATTENARTAVGMGDLHRREAQPVLPNTGAPGGVGIGNLRRFDSFPKAGAKASGQSSTGMGELRRFESQQQSQAAGTDGSTSP